MNICKRCGNINIQNAVACNRCGNMLSRNFEKKEHYKNNQTKNDNHNNYQTKNDNYKINNSNNDYTIDYKKEHSIYEKSESNNTKRNSNIYIIDLFANIIRSANIAALIYLVLNFAIVLLLMYFVFCKLMGYEVLNVMIFGVVLYIFSLFIALSPIGEFVLRIQTGCKKISREDINNRLQPIFNEVYVKAKKHDPSINDNIKLYIVDDKEANAFATGRKTIAVTKGLLSLEDNEIKGILAHEFGHISHHDTDLILLITVGNFMLNAILVFIKLIINILYYLFAFIALIVSGEDGIFHVLVMSLFRSAAFLLVTVPIWIWSKIGALLVLSSSRKKEFEADKFSWNLGYGSYLCSGLDKICGSDSKGVFAVLSSTHPPTDERIGKLMSY